MQYAVRRPIIYEWYFLGAHPRKYLMLQKKKCRKIVFSPPDPGGEEQGIIPPIFPDRSHDSRNQRSGLHLHVSDAEHGSCYADAFPPV